MNTFFGSVWWLLVTLGLLITFHEFGHFVVARRCGVKVLRFSVGFGKALWSRRDRHGTEFTIAAIPLGGYVKMLDEREGDVDAAELDQAHNRKSVGQRMAIAAAGPAFNLIFTIAAFWLMFLIGKPDYLPVLGHVEGIAATAGLHDGDRIVAIDGDKTDTWTDAQMTVLQAIVDRRDVAVSVLGSGGGTQVHRLPLSTLPDTLDEEGKLAAVGLVAKQLALAPVVGSVDPATPATAAGLRVGDRLVSIGGDAIGDWRDVSSAIQKHAAAGTPLALQVERNGARVALDASPTRMEQDGKTSWVLGIKPQVGEPNYDATLRYGPIAALGKSAEQTWKITRQTVGMLWSMLTGQASLKNVSGVITIAQVANQSAQLGLAWFLNFLAVISLSLAILNLLPIPILDGGHLLYYLIELVKGSPVSERVQVVGQYVGLSLLVALMALAFHNDILRVLA